MKQLCALSLFTFALFNSSNFAYSASLNSWINTNAAAGGTTIRDLKTDGSLGVVLGGTGGVGRFDDTGALLWLTPFLPATNVSNFNNNGFACAVDGLGNTFVATEMRGVVSIGGLSATNAGIVTGNNPNARGTLLAKLDSAGQGVWIKYIDGGFDYTKLAVDGGGGVLISGGHTSVLNFGSGGTAQANSFASGIIVRYAADGTRAWIRDYPYSSTTGSVEIDAVTAQGSNIWVGGIFNFSVKFGAFSGVDTASGHPYYYWIGCLNTNGTEQWLQTLPSGAQGLQLGVGPDKILWAANAFSPSTLARFSTNGTTLTYASPGSSSGGTLSVANLTVDTNNLGVISGYFNFSCTIGTNSFTQPNTLTNNCYSARYNTNGAGLGAVVDGFSVNNGSAFQLFAGNSRGDVYVAGLPAARLGSSNIAGTNFFLAKFNAPVLAPYIITQPNSGSTNQSRSFFQLAVTAGGQAPLSYQWRNNGVPIASGTNATFTIASPLPPDNGSYDCVVSNAYGTTTSTPSQVVFTPPFTIFQQPNSIALVFGTNAVAGSNIVAGFIDPKAMIGHAFNCFITNGSGMWPASGNFLFNLASASAYNIPSGTVSNHSGSWNLQVALSDQTILNLYYWATSPSNIPSSLAFHLGGAFDIHHDITDPTGCCANGYFTIAPGGSSNAIFTVSSSGSVLPTVQWYRNGVLLSGETNTTLKYLPAGYPQVGTYTATLSYSNYVVTTTPATLNIYPPALGYTFIPANGTMNFAIPLGYALQAATQLAPPDWITISTNSTYTVPANQPGGYFRIVPQ